jgi:hypothetical protein
MRPLILHNVPDDELYTGEDGVQRPYAMIFPEYAEHAMRVPELALDSHVDNRADRQREAPRRRNVPETGAFGKSLRRSRSRTGSLPPAKLQDATMHRADEIFQNYINSQQQAASNSGNTQRKSNFAAQSVAAEEGSTASQAPRFVQEPTEVILRGYRSPAQQYAAINHYENIAGRVCEDYSREPPVEQRRYKSELRDPVYTRRRQLTPQERAKVNQVDGGEHWIKVTFESADAADAAIFASPQRVLGHLIYAEPYHGLPPKEDAAVVDLVGDAGMLQDEVPVTRTRSLRHQRGSSSSRPQNGKVSALPKSWTTPSVSRNSASDLLQQQGSPPESQSSTQTIDSTTATASSATVTGMPISGSFLESSVEPPPPQHPQDTDSVYCRRIPTARRVKLMPAEQALLPQPGVMNRIISRIPLIKWFGGSMIGDEVPRTETGEFDFNRASLYWQLMYYLDYWFGLFGYEIVSADSDKDD